MSRTAFILFHVGFFACMWLSKTVHVLYFEEHHAVVNFGISYSMMALAGYFSFFIGHISDVWGFSRLLIFGALLYSAGLILRIFPDSAMIAFVSGCIAGVGASTCLSAMRIWMLSLMTEESKARFVGLKSSCTALGTALGCIVAGLLPFSSREMLLYSGLGMLLMSIGVAFLSTKQVKLPAKTGTASPWKGLGHLFSKYRKLAIITSVLGCMTGLYVSFIGPYLPLLMKDKGLSLTAIGLSSGSLALIRFCVDPWIAKVIGRYKTESLWIFLCAELLICLATASILLPFSQTGFVLLLLMRSIFLGFSAISEELLWLRVFPTENMGLFFGLNQSAFFVGDFLGGLLNGYIYKTFGLTSSIHIVIIVMLLNSVIFFRLIHQALADKPLILKTA